MNNNFEVTKTIDLPIFKKYKNDCINCKKCVKSCIFLQEYCNSPKDFLNNLNETKKINEIMPYYCSLCGCCKRECPKDINMGDVFQSLREEITTKNKGIPPINNAKIMEFHQYFSNKKVFTGILGNVKTKIFFMPGCSLNGYGNDLSLKTYKYLSEHIDNLGLILNCCNKPTLDLGKRALFNKKFHSFVEELKKFNNGDIEIITACQSCFKILKQEAPELKITSLWALFKEFDIPKSEILKGKDSELEFSIKDSCQGLDYNEIQDGIRYIMCRLGYKFDNPKVSNTCCGLGGLVHLSNPNLSNKIKVNSLNQLKSKRVVTYCGGCLGAVNNSSKTAYHILELIFESNETLKNRDSLNMSTISNWQNRYTVASKFKKLVRK